MTASPDPDDPGGASPPRRSGAKLVLAGIALAGLAALGWYVYGQGPDGAVREVLKACGRLRGVRDPMYFRVLEL